jgi:hypothetical protein
MRKAIWTSLITLLLLPATARAQTGAGGSTGSGTNGLGLSKTDFADFLFEYLAHDDDGDHWKSMNKTTFDTFFNRQRCECNEPVRVRVSMQNNSRSKISTMTGTVKLRAGDQSCICQSTSCPAVIACNDLGATAELRALANDYIYFDFGVRELFAAGRGASTDASTICDRDDFQNVYLWIDGPDSDTSSDLTDTSTQVKMDGIGPAAPTGVSTAGGEQALTVSWNEVKISDFQGYQVLCSRADQYQVFADPPRARFSGGSCSAAARSDGGVATTDAGASADASTSITTGALSDSADAGTTAAPVLRGAPPPPLARLDPAFTCSDLLTAGTSTRIRGLQNGIPYLVGVVAVDQRGNASKLTEVVLGTPTQTRDFYSGYRRDGGGAEGGYCALLPAGTSGAAGASWAVAGLGLALVLRRRARRMNTDKGARS